MSKETRMRCLLAFGIPSKDDTILKNHFTLISAHVGVGEELRKGTLAVIRESMNAVKGICLKF